MEIKRTHFLRDSFEGIYPRRMARVYSVCPGCAGVEFEFISNYMEDYLCTHCRFEFKKYLQNKYEQERQAFVKRQHQVKQTRSKRNVNFR